MKIDSNIIAAIIEAIVTLIVGFLSGYMTGIKITKKQIQKAKDNASQIQIGEINYGRDTKSKR